MLRCQLMRCKVTLSGAACAEWWDVGVLMGGGCAVQSQESVGQSYRS